MTNTTEQPDKFFKREASFKLTHKKGDSSLVLFSTSNNLALAVVVFSHSHLKKPSPNGLVDVKHFPAQSLDEAKEQALKWAKEQIDTELSVSSF